MFHVFVLKKSFTRQHEKYGTATKATDDNIIWHMRLEFWLNKATDTHSETVMLVAFPQQLWLHKCVSVMLYIHCLSCLVLVNAIHTHYTSLHDH
jgi:hypothetical protein